jgi:hypothetical protein
MMASVETVVQRYGDGRVATLPHRRMDRDRLVLLNSALTQDWRTKTAGPRGSRP